MNHFSFVLRSLAIGAIVVPAVSAQQSPQGGTVVAGSASIASVPGNTTITQTSERAILDWQRFDIGATQSVRFVQPGADSVALNRVLGADPSRILGSMTANGKVFLVNPNGILFGAGAQVSVGGLVASTRNIGNLDFMSGDYRFTGAGSGSVVNEGVIDAGGGYVALLGASVSNQGVIAARLGSVVLAAGEAFTLDVVGDGLLSVAVDAGAVGALVQNGGLIQADGGQVLLTALSAGDLLPAAVNNSGVIQARTIENRNGSIRLLGDLRTGSVTVDGTLDASAPQGGNGGFIDTSAARVRLVSTALVTTAAQSGATGQWLIDPADFTIAASGGDMTGTQLSTGLGLSNVTIMSSSGATGVAGDIHVNDTVTWSANRLTLNAVRNIDINTAMYGSGSASLTLAYGQGAAAAGNAARVNVYAPVNLPSGSNLTTQRGSDGAVLTYSVINNMTALQAINSNLAGNYALGSNLDATGVSGFAPLGPVSALNDTNSFLGVFDGLGHEIRNLTINRPANTYVGLFGGIGSTGAVRNLGVINISVTGATSVGGLAGALLGTISDSRVTGTVQGANAIGGVAGYNWVGTIERTWTGASVSTGPNYNYAGGGMVGYNYFGTIRDSYSKGPVTAAFGGGIAGVFNGGTIDGSYSSSVVSRNLYGNSLGGLTGPNYNNGVVTNSYWNVTTSGLTYNYGGIGLTTAELQAALPAGLSPTTWANGGNQTTPYLLGTSSPVLVATDVSNTYYTIVLNADALQNMNTNRAGSYALGNDIDATVTRAWNAGLGFAPVGDGSSAFTGKFDGLGHVIDGLVIDRPATDRVGLFGNASGATIRNVGLTNAEVTGKDYVGALLGATVVGVASRVFATGQVDGHDSVGGLMGYNNSMGMNDTYATADVTGRRNIGGLIGETNGGVLALYNFASGDVSGTGDNVGGLVGYNGFAFVISESYATGVVSGAANVGGLVGYHLNGALTHTYATGSVTGTGAAGGLVGARSTGTFTSNFWNTETSGQATSAAGAGLTTAQMQQRASFTGWNFGTDWSGFDGHTNPLLRAFMTALTVTVNSETQTYDGQLHGMNPGVVYSLTPDMSHVAGTLDYSGTGTNVGSSALTASGLWSDQLGYNISYIAGALTINPRTVNLTGSRVYDSTGDMAAVIFSVDSPVNGQTLTLTGSGTADRNVGLGHAVTLGTLALADGTGLAANYSLAGGTYTVDIDAAQLTFGTADVSKVYDGGVAASGMLTMSGTLFAGDTSSGGSFVFTDANAGVGKTVVTSGVTINDGNGGGNYRLAYVDNTTSTIARVTLTATAAASDKVYDGTTLASAQLTLGGLVGSETLEATNIASFNSKDVAAADLVTVDSIALADGGNGGSASNYTVTAGQTAAARITPKSLTVVGQSALSRTYDGTTIATLAGGSLVGVVQGESLTLAPAGTFAFADAGVAIPVTTADALVGAAAANYTLTQPLGLSADILPTVIPVAPAAALDVRHSPGFASAVAQASGGTSVKVIPALPLELPGRAVPAMPHGLRLDGLNLTVAPENFTREEDR